MINDFSYVPNDTYYLGCVKTIFLGVCAIMQSDDDDDDDDDVDDDVDIRNEGR